MIRSSSSARRSILRALLGVALLFSAFPCPGAPRRDDPGAAPVLRGWRTDGTGRHPGKAIPGDWSAPDAVRWKADLGSWSNATPLVVEDRVFVNAEPFTLHCLDRKTGKRLWQADHGYDQIELRARPPRAHASTGFSTPTPCSDGEKVYALYGNGVLACHTVSGQRLWIRLVDRPGRSWGHSASPLLIGDRLVVHVSEMVAFIPQTRRIAWRVKSRPRWGSPVGVRVGNLPLIVTPSGQILRASDGRVLAERLADLEYCSPVVHEGVVYFVSRDARAYRLSVRSEETDRGSPLKVEKLWKRPVRSGRYYASPVVHEGRLYAVSESGFVTCLDITNGVKKWEGRLAGGAKGVGRRGASETIYSSPTLAGDAIVVGAESGRVWMLAPGDGLRVTGENRIGSMRSCPVVADGGLFLRAGNAVICVGRGD